MYIVEFYDKNGQVVDDQSTTDTMSTNPYARMSDEKLEEMAGTAGWAESDNIYDELRRRLISRLERGWRPVSVKDQNSVIDAVTWFKSLAIDIETTVSP